LTPHLRSLGPSPRGFARHPCRTCAVAPLSVPLPRKHPLRCTHRPNGETQGNAGPGLDKLDADGAARAHEPRPQAVADWREHRLKQADIHNFLALLDLEAGNLTGARDHAEIAKERAYCDGPPHHYKPAYEEAERLLADLAARGA